MHHSELSPPQSTQSSCPFCRETRSHKWSDARSEDGALYPARECQNCGTTFLCPPPSDAQLAQAYATNYYGAGETKFNPFIEHIRAISAGFRTMKLAGHLKKDARILDVGCGDGRLLGNFRQAGFSNLHGIERPGRAADRASKIPGIRLHLGTLESVDLPSATFDLITLVHVYEHLPAPRESLDQLTRLLKPGGRLFLSFPNISSWQARLTGAAWFHLDPPRHLTLVPPQTVIAYLENHHFKLLAEHHLCLEQNTYGWIQSALNRCDSRRNFLYERLKRNRHYLPTRGTGILLFHALLGGLLLLPSLIADGCSALARAGATVELMFEKPKTN